MSYMSYIRVQILFIKFLMLFNTVYNESLISFNYIPFCGLEIALVYLFFGLLVSILDIFLFKNQSDDCATSSMQIVCFFTLIFASPHL